MSSSRNLALLQQSGRLAARVVSAGRPQVIAPIQVASSQVHPPASCCSLRLLSSSSIRRDDGNQLDKLAHMLPGLEKVRHSTQAKQALENLMKTLEANGIDLHSGKPPGMMQMAKIAMNSDVRHAAKNAMDALREAGVDVSPERITQMMMGQSGNNQNDKDAKANSEKKDS